MTPISAALQCWVGVKLTSIVAVNSPASYCKDQEGNCGRVCAELERGRPRVEASAHAGPELKEKDNECCHALPGGNLVNRVRNKQTQIFS